MNSPVETISNFIQNAHFAAWFFDALLKSFVVLALAGGVCALARRASAATRHLIWFLAVASLPCLPLLNFTPQALQRPLWAISAGPSSGNQISLALELAPQTIAQKSPAVTETSAANQNPTSSVRKVAAHFNADWMAFGLAAWLAGAALVLISVAVGQFRLRHFFRNVQSLDDADWTQLLAEARETLRLPRVVTLLQSADDVMPLTWGWRHPVVLLPAEAARWPAERRRVVLLHELAHVKRWDCLTQLVAQIVCAFYWFNPLVWLAARQMCIERERACDDLVLNGGCKTSDYAGHLVDIVGSFRRMPQAAAIAMARPSGLEQRVEAILDGRRNRSRIAKLTVACLVAAFLSLGWLIGSYAADNSPQAWSLKNSKVAEQLKHFVAEKKAQEGTLIEADETDFAKYYANASDGSKLVRPDCQPFFAAADKGDWQTVSNLWSEMEKHTLGLSKATNGYPHGMWLQPMRETYGAIEAFAVGDEKYSKLFGDEVIQSMPAGSIYFGGTDPGRFIVTALQKSQVDGSVLVGGDFTNFNSSTANHIARLNSDGTLDVAFTNPFYSLTQNALADGTYLNYLRSMHGSKIYIPTSEDSQKCFQNYVADAQVRLQENRLKPGEDIKADGGRIQVSGVVAVLEINGLLVKTIFEKNPGREFFIEESFPLDWMYPNLEPHGLIFKINRQPLTELSEAMVEQDRAYWQKLVPGMIGGWLKDDTSVQEITAFAEKVFVRHDLGGFTGDPGFVQNDYTSRMFSKLRTSIAGLYAWRAEHATDAVEKERLTRAADFAFRQALALCPVSPAAVPEAVKNYATFLKNQHREKDARLVQSLAEQFKPQSVRPSAPLAKASFFQMRLVVDAPADDAEKMIRLEKIPAVGQVRQEEVYVQKSVLLDQTALQSAQLNTGPQGDRQIEITFTSAGRKEFAKVTREHLHQRLAIIIDGKLMTAPTIQSEISGGKCQITGSFSEAEAKALTAKLNAAIAR
jgi:beta-lactamase regulating signal transducer with metallopeptidase domain